jgi:hypothetical protein
MAIYTTTPPPLENELSITAFENTEVLDCVKYMPKQNLLKILRDFMRELKRGQKKKFRYDGQIIPKWWSRSVPYTSPRNLLVGGESPYLQPFLR